MTTLFDNPDTFTSVVTLFLVDRYTTDVLDWDLETIAMEVKEEFHTDIIPVILDKIAVGQLLLKTNLFHASLPEFITFSNVMCNETGLKESWSPADPFEMTWAVAEEKLLVNEEEPFSPEIEAYIATILRDENTLTPPDSLSFVSTESLSGPLVNELSYDPIVYQASYEQSLANSDALQNYLNLQLDKWRQQIEQLPLNHGNVSFLVR